MLHPMAASMLIGKRQPSKSSLHQSGYILVGLLILIMVAGYSLAAAGTKFSEARKREREQELLKVGDTIRKAIGSYYNQTPGVVKEYPPNLESLIRDDRFPEPKRYLRKLYLDPVTQREGWGILEAPSGGVLGVYSLSAAKPYKTKNFRLMYSHFENKKYYGEWYFAYIPLTISK
jgi:type II secretory pathway pseudopilin PulG